jgi:hypothetical protein
MPTALPGALAERDQLTAILARAVTAANAYASPYADDDLAVLRRIGARFIGRSAYVWVTKADDAGHLDQARRWARRVHTEVGSEVVLQCAIFEAIYPTVTDIPIPAWVFADLGEAREDRAFRYDDIIGGIPVPGQGGGLPWRGGGVPDLARPEALRWCYYRARSYLEAGYEAIHLGQLHLMSGRDAGGVQVRRLVDAIRAAAVRHARRGWVILDAHSHGLAQAGRLLLDTTSRPLSARCLTGFPERIALIRRGGALGGIHPGGWVCGESPVLVEVDNWLGYSMDPDPVRWMDGPSRAGAGRWGWDDIAWFAHQPHHERAAFLRYAHRWARIQGPEWFFQMPVTRSLGRAVYHLPDGTPLRRYRANDRSTACPEGFGDVAAIVAAWAEPAPVCPPAPSPEPAVTGAGWAVAEPITVVGAVQALLGGVPGDAACPWSRLHHVGGGMFSRVFAMPVAGPTACTLAVGGTMTDLINQDGLASGRPITFAVARAGDLVRIVLDANNRQVAITDAVTGVSLRT